jgi:flagellar biosynthesis protein FlhB
MSEHSGEKTEQPTPRRLEEAVKRGQFARSAEVQTAFVLLSGWIGLKLIGPEIWRQLGGAQILVLGHLAEMPLSMDVLPRYVIQGLIVFGLCVGPVLAATMLGGALSGAIQNRFQTASEALAVNWERISPMSGFKRIFSVRGGVATGLSLLKLGVIGLMSYSTVQHVLNDPIFHSTVDVARIAAFLAQASSSLFLAVSLSLLVLAGGDYAYQLWQTHRDLMMTREELKDEMKHTEGNPQVKARQRRRRLTKTLRQMLTEVPKADVVITNPTHFAVALRYDRKTMKAPRIIAKGSRLNALRIREIAHRHQVPVQENKPLARVMFKYGKVGGEIPAQLYAAVAEVLAWVYRVNRYRYYAEDNRAQTLN